MKLNNNAEIIKEIFNARSVAVVGASGNPAKWGHMTLKCIIDGGYKGKLYAVNPNEKEILGVASYPSVKDLPGPVDLLIVLVGAEQVAKVLRQGAEKKVKGAAVITSGFREAGRSDLEDEISEVLSNSNIRIIGPNIQGFNYVPNNLCTVILPLIRKLGPIAMISQSGSVSATVSEWSEKEGVGITGMVNLGNQIDLCESDFLDYFSEDDQVHVIMLYLEGPKEGARFKDALIEAAAKKPVVILKPGRSQAGVKAAATHTASIAGNDRIFSHACKQYGAVRALNMEDFYDIGKAFSLQPLPKGNRVLIVTTSGGAGALTMDAVAEYDFEQISIPEELLQDLKRNVSGYGANYSNPMDLPFIDKAYWKQVMDTLAKYSITDSVIFTIADAVPGIEEVILDFASKTDITMVVSYMGGGDAEEEARDKLQKNGVPVYSTPERAVKSLSSLVWYAQYRRNYDGEHKCTVNA